MSTRIQIDITPITDPNTAPDQDDLALLIDTVHSYVVQGQLSGSVTSGVLSDSRAEPFSWLVAWNCGDYAPPAVPSAFTSAFDGEDLQHA